MRVETLPFITSATSLAAVACFAALIGVTFFSNCACCPCGQPATQPVVLCQLDAGNEGNIAEQPFEADKSPEAAARTTPCSRACASFALNHCPEATKKMGGLTCIENCHNISDKPGFSKFDPECVAKATNVDAVRACPAVTCKQ